ncbi:MAG: 50S ribosomal protein L28 [Hyphomicrobiaceae bacterium hypho_1]
MSGNLRSHAENKTKRVFRPNLLKVTLMSEVLNRKVRLRISAHALRTVEHLGGLDIFLVKAKSPDLSPNCQKLRRDITKVLKSSYMCESA